MSSISSIKYVADMCIFHVQLKDMAERLPPGAYDPESLKLVYLPNGLESNGVHYSGTNGERKSRSDELNSSYLGSHAGTDLGAPNGMQSPSELLRDPPGSNDSGLDAQGLERGSSNGTNDRLDTRPPNGGGAIQSYRSSVSESLDGNESTNNRDSEASLKSRNIVVPGSASHIESEWIEQYEPGVYITLVALRDGTRDLKRVRFRYLTFFSCRPSHSFLEWHIILCIFLCAAGEDSGNTRRRHGGRRTEKRFMRNTMCGDQTSRRCRGRVPEDRREVFHHRPRFR